ncbi:bifunctional riboflavin kinase/FMN adenylyltransferase [Agreia sp. Leaf335]|uniref:bifunctional riboflavin kinase/FAD synthetase n=1 Tax=Agreia sp. Leaf335 TaxID=1736340 RepID=UPI0006F2CC21|nr:bifunctional riboflavin kinase/FAD synthetase [Agreia sp. Leaf335]KQR22193.1 bifunctional riboflavin kinase/FMN adenylyltransferase [Agreia sp. Leaf335]
MRVFTDLDSVPADIGRTAVTIGKFDGVHAGHRAVIRQLLGVADAQSLASVVVTFDRHPLALLSPGNCPATLVGTERKIELLSSTGVDAALVLTFDRAFADQTPEEFVSRMLVDALHAKIVLVGSDFRFGARGAGDVGLLRELGRQHGFEVQLIDDVRLDGDRRVSSTWIRELLRDGDVEGAAELLGHIPTVRGMVVHGAKRGRELGFPTANLSPESQGLIPADGVYAGWLTDDGVRYPAAISVGNNPTFTGVPQKQVEAFVLDEDIDLYDHVVDVEFTHRIRGMVKYTGVGPLIEQMNDDVVRVRELLAQTDR